MLLLALLAPAFAAPPVPNSDVPVAPLYEYRGLDASGTWSADEIAALIRINPAAVHEVRGPGTPEWTVWNQVPAIAAAWLGPQAERTWHYAEGDGPDESLTTSQVVARVRAAPEHTHVVWRPGMAEWVDPRVLPSLQALVAAPPPAAPTPSPLPPANAKPPPPTRHTESTPPRTPDAPAVDTPVASVLVGGDVRIDFTAADLQRYGQDGEDAPAAGFNVSRARPILDARLGDIFSGRLAIEVAQDDHTTMYADTGLSVDVADWARGWSLVGREAWLQAEAGTTIRHRLRVGLQEPVFASRDTYEADFPFAGEARADLGRAEGLIPEEDLGIGWRGELGETWAVDLQVLNGSGGEALDDNDGKDFIARITASPGKIVTVGVSGLFGSRDADSTGQQGQGAVTLQLQGPHQRLLLEGMAGSSTEDRVATIYSGFRASGLWAVPARSTALTSLDLVARFSFYDPVAGVDAPDAHWGPAAGLWLDWNAGPLHSVRTGLTWEMTVPQDSDVEVSHDVVAEAAWSF